MQTSRSRKQVEREKEEELEAYKDIVEEEKLPLLWPLPTHLPEHSLSDENPTRHQQRLFRRSTILPLDRVAILAVRFKAGRRLTVPPVNLF